MEFFQKFSILTENLVDFDVTCSVILGTVPRLKRGRRKKNFTKTIYIAPNPRQFSHQDRVKRAHPKICSFYDHFSLGLLLEKAPILTMLEYYLMTDFLCLAWVGKGGRKDQLIARCRGAECQEIWWGQFYMVFIIDPLLI